MYLIRRVFRCKPGTARRAAEQITKIGKAYENAGQRSPIRVYTSVALYRDLPIRSIWTGRRQC